jgi:WD40 repeat protein
MFTDIAVDPKGRFVIVAEATGVWKVPIHGGKATELEGFHSHHQAFAVAISPDGRIAAAAGPYEEPQGNVVRFWDLETGESSVLGPFDIPGGGGMMRLEFVNGGRNLVSFGWDGVRLWNAQDGSAEYLGEGHTGAYNPHSGEVYVAQASLEGGEGWAGVYDLPDGEFRNLPHNRNPCVIALDPSGSVMVTANMDGTIQVGRSAGGEPHLLMGHSPGVNFVTVSPNGRWIASGGDDGTVRLWPMPDLSRTPLHTLPRDELIAKLKTLTNLRVVRDEASSTGWKIEIGLFPGWETVPEW